MANNATVEDIENKIRELCRLPPAQQSVHKAHVHKQSPHQNDSQNKTLENQLSQSSGAKAGM